MGGLEKLREQYVGLTTYLKARDVATTTTKLRFEKRFVL